MALVCVTWSQPFDRDSFTRHCYRTQLGPLWATQATCKRELRHELVKAETIDSSERYIADPQCVPLQVQP
jgi:hypothetical protein